MTYVTVSLSLAHLLPLCGKHNVQVESIVHSNIEAVQPQAQTTVLINENLIDT